MDTLFNAFLNYIYEDVTASGAAHMEEVANTLGSQNIILDHNRSGVLWTTPTLFHKCLVARFPFQTLQPHPFMKLKNTKTFH
jgi:hypothetical protein